MNRKHARSPTQHSHDEHASAVLGWMLVAVGALVLNDHLLKPSGAVPLVAGKLSDVAGLLIAPVVLAACLRALGWRPLMAARFSVAVLGLGFTVLQLSPAFAYQFDAVYSACAARLGLVVRPTVCDPLDLLALPTLILAYRFALCRPFQRSQMARVALIPTALACMATSISYVDVAPHWGFSEGDGSHAVAGFEHGTVVVSMGKQSREGSFQLGVMVRASDATVRLTPAHIEAHLGETQVRARTPKTGCEAIEVAPGQASTTCAYLVVDMSELPAALERGELVVPVFVEEREYRLRVPMEFRRRLHHSWRSGRRF